KLLFLTHRWLGIFMCLLFALWFASGIVMMYVEYPELTREEQLQHLPALDLDSVNLSPLEVAAGLGAVNTYSSLSLSSVLGRPAYQFTAPGGAALVAFADTGEAFDGLEKQQALEAARLSGFGDGATEPEHTGLIEVDQWTVTASLDSHRPLHRVALGDEAGTVLYLSSSTGQVVRDTHQSERFWNWLGSTIHWIYPYQLRQHNSVWRDLIVYLSLLGLFSIVTGTIIGFMRLRPFKKYRGTSMSPYRGWMKWHHILGLLTVVFVTTFMFSGLMSMGPWGIFDARSSAQPQIARYVGQSVLRLASLPAAPTASSALSNEPIKEVTWHYIDSEPYLVSHYGNGERSVSFDSESGNDSMRLLASIAESVPKLLPENRLVSMDLVQDYDDYYYSRHNRFRPLPVYRARFDDDESTWYHIDLGTGQPVNRVTDASRRERWLYYGLHSLDFQFLWQQRPLWDVVVILLSLIGIGFSLTSVTIAWRYLKS
ncbi:MAG: PepSY domain-containing protein, partial [Pseudomonadales bacterium]|nr:PepSY domain-containing protein [Pseudomonadales bacterium]